MSRWMKRSNRTTHGQHSALFDREAVFYFSDLMTNPYKISDALSFWKEPPGYGLWPWAYCDPPAGGHPCGCFPQGSQTWPNTPFHVEAPLSAAHSPCHNDQIRTSWDFFSLLVKTLTCGNSGDYQWICRSIRASMNLEAFRHINIQHQDIYI